MTAYDIVIGTPVHREGAYILDRFLKNQKQIQNLYPGCILVLATNEPDFTEILNENLNHWQLRGEVLPYQTEKPSYAKSRLWNIACGREAIREYFLTATQARALLFLDADMTFEPEVIDIMEKEALGQDAVFSGYRFKNHRIGLVGAGCLWLNRRALELVKFRCFEFKNGQVLNEDNVLEMDLFQLHLKIKKGIFVTIDHYYNEFEFQHINRQKLSIYRRITTSAPFRSSFMKVSVFLHFNLLATGQKILWKMFGFFEKFK